jgi:MoaA/NifB/PqqE/SkfB family radical SAM enzyme
MSDEIFHKIIKEGKELGCQMFIPFLNGEPFLQPKIFDWLDYMEKEGVNFCLFTNASLLGREKIDRLVGYKNLKYVICSINAATKETYEKVTRFLDFNKVVDNVKYLIEKAPFEVYTSFVEVEANRHEVKQFIETWGKRSKVNICRFSNWGGSIHDSVEVKGKRKPCGKLRNMYVLWDGRVCLCCADYDGQVILGDLNKQSVKEVWDSGKIYRDMHKKLNFDSILCRNCNVN